MFAYALKVALALPLIARLYTTYMMLRMRSLLMDASCLNNHYHEMLDLPVVVTGNCFIESLFNQLILFATYVIHKYDAPLSIM